MYEIGYTVRKVVSKLLRGKQKRKAYIIKWFRNKGVSIGKDCSIFCNIVSSEPYLIEIGDNVTISNDVQLITHDNSIIKATNEDYTDIFGKISIGNNCFIGAHSIILPGVEICDNIIIAAGSVVTHSFKEERIIIGGNPAKQIGTWETYLKNNLDFAFNVKGLNYEKKRKLIMTQSKRLKSK